MTADDVNDLMETGYHDGDVPSSRGMKKSTVRGYQFTLRVFFRYHDSLGVDPEHIAVYEDDGDVIDATLVDSPERRSP